MQPQATSRVSPNLPVDADAISRLLSSAVPFRRSEGVSLLHSLSPRRRLALGEAARLLATDDPLVWETAGRMARAVREEVFGRRVVLFAPLYLSNECGNNCLYCGFRRGNREARRITLSPSQAVAEARVLVAKGFRRLLLVAGEHPAKTGVEYIAEVLRAIRRDTGMRILHVNAAPMPMDAFRSLKEAGAGVYQCFQETYHPETYARMHPTGAKADYAWRVTCMDRAIPAGFGDVGIGALLGLHDFRFEVLAVLRHAERLHDTFGTFPHTISVPRFKHAFGAPIAAAPAPVSDAAFERIVILYRLSVPSAGVVVSTREPAALRERCLDIGATQVSAGSKTDPGGYGDGVRRHESEQFEVDDTRPIEEMVRVILRRGYLPSLCTSCYRRRRTGNVFTEMALDGHIKEFCLPNALLTLAEYAVGNADPALRDQCLAAVAAGRKDLDDSALRPEFDRKLSLVLSGAKDLFF
ncbi:MAG: [FeFe] hydrogenase H-cluster radical SAM maturase HydG [Deltaproteobacteria bacterium RBG_16_66_15]|nr:MAG: [FeFe] hydrogenase H-cluster radical SAM maturase HydG [Deltaproteobacteria bacterium GWB2_65_81]OGP79802.1 MAG: [FeFe] hydrogenase H-cluster radical SAM maturase HydG [Deltaproteobacteria bacterium RBG_16_66_15]HAM33292.1 [FeFe] hydrogenase H-cluster radical SAM maturase HydG [Deltaproteobacteria bacterium]